MNNRYWKWCIKYTNKWKHNAANRKSPPAQFRFGVLCSTLITVLHSWRKHDAVPEQGWELQSLVCMCGPEQLLPPCCGEGELQNRSLVWTPESHSDEHWDHSDHADQPPFTGRIQLPSAFYSSWPSHIIYGEMKSQTLCYLCGCKVYHWIPGHWTVLQGSCSSLSPSQAESKCAWLNGVSVRLQLRNRRLNPTSSTWLKHVLLHSDQLVHLLHTPSGSTAQERDKVLLISTVNMFASNLHK